MEKLQYHFLVNILPVCLMLMLMAFGMGFVNILAK